MWLCVPFFLQILLEKGKMAAILKFKSRWRHTRKNRFCLLEYKKSKRHWIHWLGIFDITPCTIIMFFGPPLLNILHFPEMTSGYCFLILSAHYSERKYCGYLPGGRIVVQKYVYEEGWCNSPYTKQNIFFFIFFDPKLTCLNRKKAGGPDGISAKINSGIYIWN